MNGLFLVTVLQISAFGATSHEADQAYVDAYRRSVDSGRPFVVLVGADWCGACQKMRKSILPQVARVGGLRNVELAYVNLDRQRELAARLVHGRSIPQLIRFDRTARGWQRTYLVGAKSVPEVYRFLQRGSVPGSSTAAARPARSTIGTAAKNRVQAVQSMPGRGRPAARGAAPAQRGRQQRSAAVTATDLAEWFGQRPMRSPTNIR